MKLRLALSSLVVLALSACATNPPATPAVSAEGAASNFAARSLTDPGLLRFLAENLGQVPAKWDADALCWVAFYYHPSLAVARAQWATTRAAQQTAAARPNPTIALTPGYNTTREAGVSPWFPGINFDFLFQGGEKRAHQQDIARADAEAARLSVLTAVWPVRIGLGAALADVAGAARRERAFRAQAAGQRELLKLIEQRQAAGAASANEVSTVRLAALRTETAAVDAANEGDAARVRTATALAVPLAALTGIELPEPPPVTALAGEALAAARRESLHTRSDVLAALARVRSAEAALALEAARQQPDFHLGPGYQWDQGANKWSVALTFELPLFHRNEGPLGEALARRAEAVAQFDGVQALAVAEIETAVAANATATAHLDQARRVRAELEQQRAHVQQRVLLGAAGKNEVVAARLELAIADAAVADAEVAVGLAGGQLEDALQLPFPHLAALADAARVQLTHTP